MNVDELPTLLKPQWLQKNNHLGCGTPRSDSKAKDGLPERRLAEREPLFSGTTPRRLSGSGERDAWGQLGRTFEFQDEERSLRQPRPSSGPGGIGSLDTYDSRRYREEATFRSHSARSTAFRGPLQRRGSESPRDAHTFRGGFDKDYPSLAAPSLRGGAGSAAASWHVHAAPAASAAPAELQSWTSRLADVPAGAPDACPLLQKGMTAASVGSATAASAAQPRMVDVLQQAGKREAEAAGAEPRARRDQLVLRQPKQPVPSAGAKAKPAAVSMSAGAGNGAASAAAVVANGGARRSEDGAGVPSVTPTLVPLAPIKAGGGGGGGGVGGGVAAPASSAKGPPAAVVRSRNTFFEALRRKTAAVAAPAGPATGEDSSVTASADAPSGTSHATGSAPHTPDAAHEQLAGPSAESSTSEGHSPPASEAGNEASAGFAKARPAATAVPEAPAWSLATLTDAESASASASVVPAPGAGARAGVSLDHAAAGPAPTAASQRAWQSRRAAGDQSCAASAGQVKRGDAASERGKAAHDVHRMVETGACAARSQADQVQPPRHRSADLCIPAEEEAFLRSLGWEECNDDETDGGLTEEEIATFQMKVQAVRLPVLHAARAPYGAAALPYGGVHAWGLAPSAGVHAGLGLGAGSCVGPSR